jgi:hypothetical protein
MGSSVPPPGRQPVREAAKRREKENVPIRMLLLFMALT